MKRRFMYYFLLIIYNSHPYLHPKSTSPLIVKITVCNQNATTTIKNITKDIFYNQAEQLLKKFILYHKQQVQLHFEKTDFPSF